MLSLQIESYQKASSDHPVVMKLEQGALTIGRDPANSWCLPDPGRVLSKQHCLIENLQGVFQLTDTSTNGVYINDSASPIGRNNTVALNAGDRIRLSDYEILVSIEAQVAAPEPQVPSPQPVAQVPPPTPPPPVSAQADAGDWKAMLEDTPPTGAGQAVPDVQRAVDVPDMAQSHYDAPSVGMSIPEDWGQEAAPSHEPAPAPAAPVEPAAFSGAIPENFMEAPAPAPAPEPEAAPAPAPVPKVAAAPPPVETNEPSLELSPEPPPKPSPELSPEPSPEPPPEPISSQPIAEVQKVAPAAPSAPASTQATADANALVNAFMKGAGLEPQDVMKRSPVEMMEEVGGLFRQVTMGLMGVLAARGDIKSEFRLSQTMIKPMENNPLKFSLNIDEAMLALLSKKGKGYMAADAAFEEAFDDLKAHQVAVLTGMQSALKSLLEKLDPAVIENHDGEAKGVRKLLGNQKAQYWDDFVLLYKTLFQKTEDDFQTVFGHEFAKAYEEQIRKQKSDQ